MIHVRLASDRYAGRIVTLRTSANGWRDISGTREDDGWSYVLDDVEGDGRLRLKFVLDWGTWMDGDDLSITPEPGGEYVFTDDDVRFGPRIGFQTLAYAERAVTLRLWRDDATDDLHGVYRDGAWRFQLDTPTGSDLQRFAFVLDGDLVMEGAPLALRPEPGGEYLYTETDVRFGVRVRLVTERYADRLVTVRTPMEEVHGRYEQGAWAYVLDAARYPRGTPFRFLLDGDTAMDGADLALEPTAGEQVEVDEASAPAALAADADIPRITVTRPAGTVTAGYPVTMHGVLSRVGSFSDGHIAYVTQVDVNLSPFAYLQSSQVSDDGRAWAATIMFPLPGVYDLLIVASWTISYSDGRPNETGTSTPPPDPPWLWPISLQLTVADPKPIIDASGVQRRTGNIDYNVFLRVQAPVPIESVKCHYAGAGAGTPLSNFWGDYWTGSFRLPVTNPVPADGVPVDIAVEAKTKVAAGSASWTVQVADLTPPSLVWQKPEDLARIEVLTAGADAAVATVVVDITDAYGIGSGVVSAGVTAGNVTCTVDGTEVITLTPVQGGDPVRWQGTVSLSGRAQLAAGNGVDRLDTLDHRHGHRQRCPPSGRRPRGVGRGEAARRRVRHPGHRAELGVHLDQQSRCHAAGEIQEVHGRAAGPGLDGVPAEK